MEFIDTIKISVVVPAFNAEATLARCLSAILESTYPNYECIVVDDSSTDKSAEISSTFPVIIRPLQNGPLGPSHARNIGANIATGDILLFIDSDVVIYPDTLDMVAAYFDSRPEVSAMFGAYDDKPADDSFISQYKNLLHHFVHWQSKVEVNTFWSGCGAIRREVFIDCGGFDEMRFPKPSIEDIDLGARLRNNGHRIELIRGLKAKHLKRWTFTGLLRTDICNRAIPWTLLILRQRNLPNDLNLGTSQRFSALLATLILFELMLLVTNPIGLLLFLLSGLYMITLNFRTWPNPSRGYKNFRVQIQSSEMVLSMGVIGLSTMIAYFTNAIWAIPFLLGYLLIGGALYLLTKYERNYLENGRQSFFYSLIFLIVGSCILLLLSLPLYLYLPICISILLMVILNHRLYQFLLKKHRLLFTIGAVPMQIMYFLYSSVSFVIAIAMYYWDLHFNSSLGAKSL
jgi:glycosyltransferase involved in cell wall biosynthesis